MDLPDRTSVLEAGARKIGSFKKKLQNYLKSYKIKIAKDENASAGSSTAIRNLPREIISEISDLTW